MSCEHQPVMLDEVLQLLSPRPGGRYVDLTLGLGGHARRILEQSSPDGELLGIDRDPFSLKRAQENLASYAGRVRVIQGSFSRLPDYLQKAGWERVDGLLADLGVSSVQLGDPRRGFSFQHPGPLDMRMDPRGGETLADRLDAMDPDNLADLLRRFGEVKRPGRTARRILEARRAGRLEDTGDLARVAARGPKTGKTHPATRVFMALRIMVNQELDELNHILRRLPEPLAIGGRAVFISFHSLEDRLVKQRFQKLEGRCNCPPGLPVCRCGRRQSMRLLGRRAKKPSARELDQNPRARSARLRAAERAA